MTLQIGMTARCETKNCNSPALCVSCLRIGLRSIRMASDSVLGMLRMNETVQKGLGRVAQANYTYILLRASLLSAILLRANQ